MINRGQRPGRLKPERSDSNQYNRVPHTELQPLRPIAMPFPQQNVLSFRFEPTHPVNFIPAFDPNTVPAVIPESDDNSKDIESRKEHFLWEEIDAHFIPILIRNEDDRYFSRTLLEIILFRNESWDRLSPFSRQLESLIGFPLTKYELDLLHKICEFHMNGAINGVSYSILRSTINNDLLIFYDDFLDFYDSVKKLKDSVSSAPLPRNKRGSVARFQIPVVLGSLIQNSGTPASHENVVLQQAHKNERANDNFRDLVVPSHAADIRSFIPLTSVGSFLRTDAFGWVQINNVFLPFVTKRSQRFFAKYVPIEILMTCNVITENDSLVKNFMMKVTAEDLKLLNKLISDVKIFNEQLPESTYLINLYHLMMCVSNVYIKFLAVDNPRKCVTRRYKEILNFTGGGMQIHNKLIPYLLADNQYLLPISMCADDASLMIQLRSHSRPSKMHEIEYMNLLLVYFSIDRVLLPDEPLIDLISLYSIAKFSSAPRHISLEDFQKQERAKLLSIVVKYNSEKKQNTLPLGEMILAGVELVAPTPVSFTPIPLPHNWNHTTVNPCRGNSICRITSKANQLISAKPDSRTCSVVNPSNVVLNHSANPLMGMNQYPVIFNPMEVSSPTGQVATDQNVPPGRQVIFNPPILLVPNSHSGHQSCSTQSASLLSNTISFVINAQNNVIVNHPNSNVDWQAPKLPLPPTFKQHGQPLPFQSSYFSGTLPLQRTFNVEENRGNDKTTESEPKNATSENVSSVQLSPFEFRGKKLTSLQNTGRDDGGCVSVSELKQLFFPNISLEDFVQYLEKHESLSMHECNEEEVQLFSKYFPDFPANKFISSSKLNDVVDGFEKHVQSCSQPVSITGSKKRKAQKPTPCFHSSVSKSTDHVESDDNLVCKLRPRPSNQVVCQSRVPCRLLRSNAAKPFSDECKDAAVKERTVDNNHMEEMTRHQPFILDVQVLGAVKVHKALYALFKKPGYRKKQIISVKNMNFHQPKCFRGHSRDLEIENNENHQCQVLSNQQADYKYVLNESIDANVLKAKLTRVQKNRSSESSSSDDSNDNLNSSENDFTRNVFENMKEHERLIDNTPSEAPNSYRISSFIDSGNNKKTESLQDSSDCDRGNIFYNLCNQDNFNG